MEGFIDNSAVIVDCKIFKTAKIYKNTYVARSILRDDCIIGDFTRAEDCMFDDGVKIQRQCLLYGSKLGRYSYTGKNCNIWHSEVGSFCSISWNVSIGGANHDYSKVTSHSFLYAKEFGFLDSEPYYNRFTDHCIVGNDVWIAANACVCRGVTIGDGAVIGAGAVVTRDVMPYEIIGGVPARQIKMRFDCETVARLLKIKWWEFPKNIIKENIKLFNSKPSDKVLSQMEELKSELI